MRHACAFLRNLNAIAHIRYSAVDGPDAPDGILIYIKPSLNGNEPADVQHYAAADPLFPHQPTLNLEAFTMATPESEWHRVVRHETGHTLGFPHEHMRRQLVAKIDAAKAIKFFKKTQGWSAAEVRAQVLTPIEDSSILGTPTPDPNSIMCYQIPGAITKDGKPIAGGLDIDPSDATFAASIYPKA